MAAGRRAPGILFLVQCLLVGVGGAATFTSESVRTRDGRRDYRLAVPDPRPAGPLPLVLLLHGHGGSAASALGGGLRPSPLAAWLAIADREQVLVAALQGATGADGQPGWNDCRSDLPGAPRTDDVAFARAAVTQLESRHAVDASRVYAMGMSNGAMMCFRLALELEPPLAGFAAVSGSMAARSQCGAPRHPVAALVIAGTADPLVPYGGGMVHFGRRERGSVIGVEDAVRAWTRADGVAGEGRSEPLPHLHSGDDSTSAVRTVWGADGSPQVELVRVENGGHVEPSLAFHYGALYSRLVGAQNRDLESAEEAWRFLRRMHAQEAPAHR